ncbi:MAG TPA: oligosaccharide flippase family protein [Candidatus Binataceae bacterium]
MTEAISPLPRREQHAEDVSTLARGSGVTFLGGGLSFAVGALAQLLVARFLGPQRLGIYSIGRAITQIGTQVAPLGLSSAVIYYAARHWKTETAKLRDVLVQSIGATLVSGLIFFGLLYLSAPWIALRVFHDSALTHVLRMLSPAIAIFPALRVAKQATGVSFRMQYRVYIDLAGSVSFIAIFLAFLLWGGPLRAAVLAYVGSTALGLVVACYFLRRLFADAFSDHTRPEFILPTLFAYALPAFLSALFTAPLESSDRLIVGYFCPANQVGLYQAASQAATAVGVGLFTVGAIAAPMIANLYSRGEIDRLSELFRVSTKWVFYFGLVAFLLMASEPRVVMTFLYGRKFHLGGTALVILSFGRLIDAAAGSARAMLLLTGHQNRLLRITSFTLVLQIVLSVILTPRFGIAGAASARALATLAVATISLIAVKTSLGLWPYDARYLKGLLAAAVTGVLLLASHHIPLHSAPLRLALAAVVSAGTFTALLMITGLDEEDWHVFSMVQRRLRRSGLAIGLGGDARGQ